MDRHADLAAGLSRRRLEIRGDEDSGDARRRASMLDLYGISGLPTTKELTGGLNTQNISGYQSFGRDWSSPQWQNPLVINPKVNYSKIWGRHTVKLGYECQAIDTLLNDFNWCWTLGTREITAWACG